MSKTILFSPVGGNDPISLSNFRDGSMLHIFRFFKPDIVYLYMSKEVIEKHELDNRYLFCLKKLEVSQKREGKVDYRLIERRELIEVQEFDYYYEDLKNELLKIKAEMDESDRLLLNISSGTPAMKSALIVLNTLGEFDATAIQVSTPVRSMQEHTHKGYNNEECWELNEDNNPECENRCKEVICPNLLIIKNEELIKKLVNNYDYEAAIEVANTMPVSVTANYLSSLHMAASRILLDLKNVDKYSRECGIDCIPIKDSDKRKEVEYALALEITLKKHEYTNFIRGISPLLFDLFLIQTNRLLKANVYDFCSKDKNGVYRWDSKKLDSNKIGKEVLNILNNKYPRSVDREVIKSDNLREIIVDKSDNLTEKDLVDSLRNVEEKIRNLAAHEIVSITEERIKQLAGLSSKAIMDKIKLLFMYADINVKNEYWSSYDKMNDEIVSTI